VSTSGICILGGTGFVGRHLAARLARHNLDVKILTRSPARHRELLVLPGVSLMAADVHDPETLKREFAGSQTVINLVGILNERGHRGRGFERAHVELAGKVLDACAGAGVTRLVHMGALNAAEHAPSHYLRSKGRAADLLLAAQDALQVTVFEPSVMFGAGDSFINRFAALLKLAPGIFPLACPRARLAPVYVGDVADALIASLQLRASFGRRYRLCGPHSYTLRELLRYTARVMGLHRIIIGLPPPLSWLQAALMEWMPGKPFSLDNYRSLKLDSVCTRNDFTEFGIQPLRMEAVVPTYLGSSTQEAELSAFRRLHD
jgi:uncharacterized protein YbjT (DUF2867 family)